MKDEYRRDLVAALDALAEDGFRPGEKWTQAHETAQAHEGEAMFDRLHGLCHRIEGDAGNARYWYRRAGVVPHDGSFEEEASAIRRGLDG